MANQKKRTAWSVQDVVSGRASEASSSNPRFKSGYSGPKKSSSNAMNRYASDSRRGTGVIPAEEVNRRIAGASRDGNSNTNSYYRSNNGSNYGDGRRYISATGYGILDFAWIAFAAILGICVLVAVLVYNNNAYKREGYSYPTYVFTMNGVLNQIHDDYAKGGLGSAYRTQTSDSSEEEIDKENLLGEVTNESTLPNTTTGATMTLDTGSTYGDYQIATSYDELMTQLEKALSSNDFGFVGMKLAYTDESTGDLIGYPQSVVEHFTQYMSENADKRDIFMNEIKDEDTYMVKNQSAYLVKLPILKFTINMGYDNTTLSISGFSDKQMNAGQSAVVSPMLPCMYTITVSTDGGSQSSDVECDMSEGNLQVNIGVAK